MSDRYADSFAEDTGTSSSDLAEAKVGGGGADCDIVTKYKSECYFPITYVYVKSGKVQWKRTIDVYTKTQLQQASHEVFLRYTNKYSKSMKVRGNAMYVKESSVPVEIAILGDLTGPRFPCYAKSQKKNCEWPNGKEAGVF